MTGLIRHCVGTQSFHIDLAQAMEFLVKTKEPYSQEQILQQGGQLHGTGLSQKTPIVCE